MKRLLIILIVALICATCVVPVLADSDDNSGNRSPDSGPDDVAGNGSDDSSDDSPGDLSDDNMDDSPDSIDDGPDTAPSSRDDSGPDDLVDDSPDDSGQETGLGHTEENELEDHILKQEIEIESELEREGIDDAVRNNQKVYLVGVDAFQYVTELNSTYDDDLTGIETELGNSLAVTTRAEMQIRSRDAVTRFFMGGDETAAHQLEQHIDANEVRINELEQLIGKCTTCNEQVREQLRDLIQEMDQEQDRLRELSRLELQDRGILGWIWK